MDERKVRWEEGEARRREGGGECSMQVWLTPPGGMKVV